MLMKTAAVAKLLGVHLNTMYNLIRRGDVPAPAMDWNGTYAWDESAVHQARDAIAALRPGRRPVRKTNAGHVPVVLQT